MMLTEIDRAARRLTAGGAHLVITTMPPRAPNEIMTHSSAAAETSSLRACRPGTAGWLCPAQQFTGNSSHAARK
jgi:hypothetical protein